MSAKYVVAGHICLDLIPELHAGTKFEPGRLYESGPITMSTGGAVSNVGRSLHQLGAEVTLVGKVADDIFGGAISSILGPLGDSLSVAKGESTSYSVVLSAPGRDRTFLHHPGCNDTFCSDDVSSETLSSATHFHFGYPPLMKRMFESNGDELVSLFQKAKAAGCFNSLDLSLPDPSTNSGRARWETILSRVLPFVDLFVPSVDELQFMLRDVDGADTVEGVADWCMTHGAQAVAIKLGDQGLYYRTATNIVTQPCLRVEVAGTAGAGDATIAGLLYALGNCTNGTPPWKFAVAVGAFACEKPDTTSGVPTAREVLARLRTARWEELES